MKTNLNITLLEALAGFDHQILHLDDHQVEVSKSAGQPTQHGEVMKIEDEGMPKYGMPSDYGKLYVTFNVECPKQLSSEQRERLRKLFKSM